MKTKSVSYRLFLQRINNYSAAPVASFAIAMSFGLALITAPAIAQDNTIKLQDSGSGGATTENQGVNYKDLPLLDGQSSPQSNPQTPVPTAPLPAENIEFATQETDYTLGAGDQIKLNIFQVDEYSGEYPVLVDGTISLPLVGRVDVRGLSLKETSEVVSKKYSTYLKRPIITVGLVTPRPLKIGVSGEVDNPGSYQVSISADSPQFPTVTDLLEQAGGINTIADVRSVRVTREIKGKEVIYNSNLWDLLTRGQIKQNISLRDGDTIFVPTANEINTAELNKLATASYGIQTDKPIQVAVVGEVNRPGSHFVQPEQLTRGNNGGGTNEGKQESIPPRLSQAIGAARGIKPLADVRDIKIKRTAWDGSEKIISVNLWELIQSGDTNQDLILQEGDKVVIAKATNLTEKDRRTIAKGSFNQNITVNIVGEVVTPGPVEVEPNTPLNQAILAAGGFDTQRANSNEVELVSLKPDGTVEKRKIKVDLGSEVNDETNPVLNQNDVVVVGRSGTTSATDTAGKVLSPLGALGGIFGLIF